MARDRSIRSLIILGTLVVTVLSWHALSAREQGRGAAPQTRLTIDRLIDIKHPSSPVWSRDSRHVAFMWERAGVSNLYVAPADGSAKPVAITSDGGQVAGVFWSADDRALYFMRSGNLMQASPDGREPLRQVWAQMPGPT